MKVTRRNVEVFDVCGQNIDREQARALYDSLAEALGLPRLELRGCGDRMSHSPHWHGRAQSLYCGGRSFDAT